MKQNTHPKYFDKAQVVCVCGNKFTTGSTQEMIRVELCYNCHPFYTGEHKFVDSASRIQKFQKKTDVAKKYQVVNKEKKDSKKKKDTPPKSLRDMLNQIN